MASTSQSIFEEKKLAAKGAQLWMGVAQVEGPVRAEVLLTHGLGEHASRYEHVARSLAAAGLRVHAYDLRGHGRSTGRRGDAPRYEVLLEDLDLVRAEVERRGSPVFYMGHSLGGQITLNYLLTRRPEACRGVVVTSPWLRLAFYPAWWRLAVARLARFIWPAWLQRRPALIDQLSRDLAHLQSLPQPELVHHHISARMFFQIEAAGRRALERAAEWRLPVLLMHGGADRVTSALASEEFYQAAASHDKSWRIWPETRHETHNDLDRERVLSAVVEWITARLEQPGPAGMAR